MFPAGNHPAGAKVFNHHRFLFFNQPVDLADPLRDIPVVLCESRSRFATDLHLHQEPLGDQFVEFPRRAGVSAIPRNTSVLMRFLFSS